MLLHQGLMEIHTKCPKLSKFLSSILKCMFSKGEIPLQWQSAREIYIPKSKTPPGNLISDFQPIAFLNVEGKLFFSLISKRLESHENNKIINLYFQKGCIKKVPGCCKRLSIVWSVLKEATISHINY